MNFKLFRKNIFLIVSAFVLSLLSTNFFSMDVEQVESNSTPDVIMEELVASSSTLAEMTTQDEPSKLGRKSKTLTEKIIHIINNSFNQEQLATLEKNGETKTPAVVSPEMLSFLQEIKFSIPKALEEGDKAFSQTIGYQEDLKVKLLAFLENFSKEFIPDLNNAVTKTDTIKKKLEEKKAELLSFESSRSKDRYLPQKISAKRKELVKLLVELQDYSEEISPYTEDLNISKTELSTQKKEITEANKKVAKNNLKQIAEQIKVLEKQKKEDAFLSKRPEELKLATEGELDHKLVSKKRDYNRELKNFYKLTETTKELEDKGLPTSEYPLEIDEQKQADSMVVNIRGKLYELKAALAAVDHGKNIQAFGQEIRLIFKKNSNVFTEIQKHTMVNRADKVPHRFLSPEAASNNNIMLKQEFDLITDSEIIECKSTSWNIAQYIQNLHRQQFMIEHIKEANKIYIIDANKILKEINQEAAIQNFGNRSIICYVDYVKKNLLEGEAYFQERQLIEKGFTLWNGTNYFHALTITDPTTFKAPKAFKELIEKYKDLEHFILFVIEPKEYHAITKQRLSLSGRENKKSLSATAPEKEPINRQAAISQKERQEKLTNELKTIMNIDNTENLPFTIIFIDKKNDSLKTPGSPTSKKREAIDSPEFKKVRSKIRDTPPEETPSKKVARRIEGLSMGPKKTSEDQQPLSDQGSPKPSSKSKVSREKQDGAMDIENKF